MKLIEIIRGLDTSDETVEVVDRLRKKWEKKRLKSMNFLVL